MTIGVNAFGKDLLWFVFKWGIAIYVIVFIGIWMCGKIKN